MFQNFAVAIRSLWSLSLFSESSKKSSKLALIGSCIAFLTVTFFGADPLYAHHPGGGQTPTDWLSGFLSGLGHPIIGLDHLAFVVATGLIGVGQPGAIFIPGAFVLTAMAGTGVHLLNWDLPQAEMAISLSVLVFGVILAFRTNLESQFNSTIFTILAAIAGLFHGYAYGESIIGATIAPLVAYLIGFSLIQFGVAVAVFAIASYALRRLNQNGFFLRFAGLAIAALGFVFFSKAIG